MCGISGTLGPRGDEDELRTIAARMSATMLHRGPDDGGSFVDAEVGLTLGFRRLSIVDLSEHGHQPMASGSGRYVCLFNGEIYNHRLLRAELEATGHIFRGTSDTEVLLACVERWGFAHALTRFNGMFAIALWDREDRTLNLARDRMGEKPLYYGRSRGRFLFASELKAVRAHPEFDAALDRDVLALFLRYGYVPDPHCIYRGFRKLPPGTWLQVGNGRHDAAPTPYWSILDVVAEGKADPFAGAAEEAVDELERLLADSVAMRMVADVPVGAFLSGGIDSSTIVALMQAQAPGRVRTFSIGFEEHGFDEAAAAKAVAKHLGTDHTELYVTAQDCLDVVPLLPTMYDEPFADSSQVPTHLVARLARRDVTVALSGDGGDELFGGYTRYRLQGRLGRAIDSVPVGVRRAAARAVTRPTPERWNGVLGAAQRVLPSRYRVSAPGDKLHKLAELADGGDRRETYRLLQSQWKDPRHAVPGASEPATAFDDAGLWALPADEVSRPMLLDAVTYLPGDILAKVDRATMAVSLEARVPLLDHRVVELAWRLPIELKIRAGEGKWPLRRVLDRHVPRALVDRAKQGFGVPIGGWLRGPLRPWAEELLSEPALRGSGLDATAVRARWAQHLAGSRDWKYQLWNVLMFQAWVEADQPEAARS